MCSKLVFVAAVALALALTSLSSGRSFAASHDTHGEQAVRARSSEPVPRIQPFDIFVRQVIAMSAGVDQERRLSLGPMIGLICAIVASSVALGIAFGLRRRIDRIAGPAREKEDRD
jgi:hypothetical protein